MKVVVGGESIEKFSRVFMKAVVQESEVGGRRGSFNLIVIIILAPIVSISHGARSVGQVWVKNDE